MGLRAAEDTGSRFVAFVDGLVSVIGHADRAGPLRDYCTGLVMPCERTSVEPMAAVTVPVAAHTAAVDFSPPDGARVDARATAISAAGRGTMIVEDQFEARCWNIGCVPPSRPERIGTVVIPF